MDLVSFFMNCLSIWLWCTLLLLIICTFVWIYGRIIRFSAILYILYTFLSTVASCKIVCCWLLQWNMLYTFVPATRFSEDQNPNPGATCLCKVNVQFFACKLPILLCNWYTWCETYPTPCLFSGRIGMVSVANAVIRQENVLALWKGLVPVSLFSLALYVSSIYHDNPINFCFLLFSRCPDVPQGLEYTFHPSIFSNQNFSKYWEWALYVLCWKCII